MSSSFNPYASPLLERDAPQREQDPWKNRGLEKLLFSFQGRIGRAAYWGASIGTMVVFWAIIFACRKSIGPRPTAIFAYMLYVPYLWTVLAVTVKRWHDRNKSGWWILINFIPLVGPLWAFIENGCLRGTDGPNRFGPDPTC